MASDTFVQTPNPLPMKRGEEKLKAYAVLSKDRNLDESLLKDKLVLGIIFAYNQYEAMMGIEQMIASVGRQGGDYVHAYMSVERHLEDVVKPPMMQLSPQALEAISQPMEKITPDQVEKTKEQTTKDMIAYVRYIFDKAGTSEQMAIAEEVISEFESSELVQLG